MFLVTILKKNASLSEAGILDFLRRTIIHCFPLQLLVVSSLVEVTHFLLHFHQMPLNQNFQHHSLLKYLKVGLMLIKESLESRCFYLENLLFFERHLIAAFHTTKRRR